MHLWIRIFATSWVLALAMSSAPRAQNAPSFNFVAHVPQPVVGVAEGEAYDELGAAIALSGDIMVAGVPTHQNGVNYEQGAVYVFRRSGAGWQRLQRLTASDGFTGQGFGVDVALSGDFLAIGASTFFTGMPLRQEAAVYLYKRNGDTWQLHTKLMPSGNVTQNPRFGSALAISGDAISGYTLLVGSPHAAGGSGRVFSYLWFGGPWVQDGVLPGSAGELSFGDNVAIDESRAVVGAPLSSRTPNQSGSVYVYERAGGWQARGSLTASNRVGLSSVSGFGSSVDVSGTTILVGAEDSDRTIAGGVRPATGAAFAFVLSGGDWDQQSGALFDATSSGSERFGNDLALQGDRVVVGAYGASIGGTVLVGNAFLFKRSAGVWTQASGPWRPDTTTDEHFGAAVALDGEVSILGAPDANSFGGTHNIGKIYTFGLGNSDLGARLDGLQLPDGAHQDQFGYRIAISGDTMLVASPFQEREGADFAGVVHVYRRQQNRWQYEAQLVGPATPERGDWFGWSIALKGDTAVVGALHVDAGDIADAGAVYVFTRAGTVWTQQAELRAPDFAAYDNFGSSVAIDSLTESRILVGAWRGNAAQLAADCGNAYVFERSNAQWIARHQLFPAQPQTGDLFGYAVSLDGPRAFIAAPYDDVDGLIDTGSVRVFEFTTRWTETIALGVAQAARQAGDHFGLALASERIGNRHALYVGAPGATVNGVTDGGGVFLAEWVGANPPSLTALPTPISVAAGDRLGNALSLRGGHLLVGAPLSQGTTSAVTLHGGTLSGVGAAYFYPNGDANRTQRIGAGNWQTEQWFGWGLAIGELAGGYPTELLVGAPRRDSSLSDLDEHYERGGVDVFDAVVLFNDGFEQR